MNKTNLFGDEFIVDLPETDINSFKNKEDAIDYYFNYYREHGYPNYDLNSYNPNQEMHNLINFNVDSIKDVQDDGTTYIGQTMHSCGFLWCFFPDWINTKTLNDESLSECFNDDKRLRALIEKTINWNINHGEGRWTENRFRQNAKVYCAKQTVSNFRPTAAKCIYETFGNSGKILDPCCGWGGRLLGFLSSSCKEYVGCDPNTKTVEGLNTIKNLYSCLNKDVTINNCGFEDMDIPSKYFDLAFTSPPYFNTEKYSDESTQSYKKFPTYNEWKNGFLTQLILKSYDALKDDGTFVLNIANVRTALTLEEDSVTIANKCGFKLVDTWKLILSSIAGDGVKTEPVFIFKKTKGE